MDRLPLEARKMLIEALLEIEVDIMKINQETIDRFVEELRKSEAEGISYEYIEHLEDHLRNLSDRLMTEIDKTISEGVVLTLSAGMHQSKQTTLSLLNKADIDWKPIEKVYFRTHTQAVETMKQRTIKGLNISDRIWENSRRVSSTVGDIVQEAIKEGLNPTEVADLLERYVRDGAKTVAADYPQMFERLSVPMDLNYESLRLARTEMAAAFGHATIESARINPSSKGIQWSISNAGVTCDLCKDIASQDNGMGPGVYKVEDLPEYPAHPNCLCTLSEVTENTDDFVERLIEWNKNPLAQPDIEKWYQDVYRQGEVT